MALILYNLAIWCFRLVVWSVSPFHLKAKKMIAGRHQWDLKLRADMDNIHHPIVWFHCASLGEFEQGRPVIESFRASFPKYRILLTFYSPSGYEVRRNYQGADAVHYLPWDSLYNARIFYDIVNPVAAVFIKYEFWYHLINEGRRRSVPVVVCSAIFRKNQIFFKRHGGIFRDMLRNLDHIFVQDNNSYLLLTNININAVTVAGDTRIDRVAAIIKEEVRNEVVEQFINGQETFIVGSSWPQDIEVLAPIINSERRFKFIIAPHEINEVHLGQLDNLIERPLIHYSKFNEEGNAEVLIIDTIGILSHLYKYGNYAYIGGAFGKGLHNILEAATFGLPLFFGNRNYTKFGEAKALVELGGAFAIGDSNQLQAAVMDLAQNQEHYQEASQACRRYIKQNTGATETIMDHLRQILTR